MWLLSRHGRLQERGNEKMNWSPSKYQLQWTQNLYKSLKDGGIWTFSSAEEGKPVSRSNATFKKQNNKMKLVDIHIENISDSLNLFARIEQAKICFEKLGIPCQTENAMDSCFVDMVTGAGGDIAKLERDLLK